MTGIESIAAQNGAERLTVIELHRYIWPIAQPSSSKVLLRRPHEQRRSRLPVLFVAL